MAGPDSIGHEPTLSAPSDASTNPVGNVAAGDRLAAGAQVGDYVIDRFLGAGAMGEVYAGHHPVIGKKVAIKLLRAELASSPESAERFVREARAVNQIDHPNVIDIFNFGRTPEGRLFLVMDFVAGSSLRARVSKGALPLVEAFDILAAIAGALDAAHARGVVHRDLKPDNVMLTDDDPPKVFVLDFGIAKLVKAAEIATGMSGNGTLTGQGTWLGTPGYMAPEQWSSDGAGPPSDRYALGVMAFELIAGKLPFSAPNLPAMMEQHFRGVVPALSTIKKDPTLELLDPVLVKAMAKNPDERFATGMAMVEALRDAAKSKLPAARPASPSTKKAPWMPAAIGAGVLGMSVLGVIAVRGGNKDKPEATDPAASSNNEVPAGTVELMILTTPPGAEIREGTNIVGTSPAKVHPKPGTRLSIAAKKPGYEASTIDVTTPALGAPEAARTVALQLLPITGFEGIWRLENGELREMRRAGDRVDIFKRAAVSGPREPYRSYDMVASDDAPLTFAGSEDVMGRGTEHRCIIPHKVTYHYDPKSDALDVQRERVGSKVEADGQCVIVSREPGVRTALVRVDTEGDVRYSDAPVGKPPVNTGKDNAFNDSMDNILDKNQKDAGPKDNSNPKNIPQKPVPPPPTFTKKTPPKQAPSKEDAFAQKKAEEAKLLEQQKTARVKGSKEAVQAPNPPNEPQQIQQVVPQPQVNAPPNDIENPPTQVPPPQQQQVPNRKK